MTAGLTGCASAPPPRRFPAPPPARRDPAIVRRDEPSPPAPEPAPGSIDTRIDPDIDPRRNEIVFMALTQIGVPYVWGGMRPVPGFDCSGLVSYVFRAGLRLALPRTAAEQARIGRSIEDEPLRPADLVFYNTLGREFSHVGLYVGGDRFIHAPHSRGFVRIENMRVDYWRDRWNGARRVIA